MKSTYFYRTLACTFLCLSLVACGGGGGDGTNTNGSGVIGTNGSGTGTNTNGSGTGTNTNGSGTGTNTNGGGVIGTNGSGGGNTNGGGGSTIYSVSNISPANGSINIPARPEINVGFNVLIGKLTDHDVTLHSGSPNGPSIAIADITLTGNTFTFTPSSPLNYNSTYYIVFSNGTSSSFTTTTSFSDQLSGPGTGIVLDNTGNSYVTETVNFNAYFEKYRPDGTLVWSVALPIEKGTANGSRISRDDAGNIYVAGNIAGNLIGQTQNGIIDYFIAKLSPDDGSIIWAKQDGAFIFSGVTNGLSIATDSSGNSYVTGLTNVGLALQPQTGLQDCFIAKYDTNGTRIWGRQFGAPGGNSAGTGISLDNAGHIYITGNTTAGLNGHTQQGKTDYIVAKYDTDGNLLKFNQIGSANTTAYPSGISLDSNNNMYISGYTDGGLNGQTQQGISDYFVAKHDPDGNLIWLKQVGTAGAGAFAMDIKTDGAGTSFITGSTSGGISGQTLHGTNDLFIARYDTSGALIWTTLEGSAGSSISGNGIGLDQYDNTYIVGTGFLIKR